MGSSEVDSSSISVLVFKMSDGSVNSLLFVLCYLSLAKSSGIKFFLL